MKQAYARTAWPWAAPEEVVMHAHRGRGGRGQRTRGVHGGGGVGEHLSTHFFTFVTTITSGSLFTCRSLKGKKMMR